MTAQNSQSMTPRSADRRSFLRRSLQVGALAAPLVVAASARTAHAKVDAPPIVYKEIQGHENTHVDTLVVLLGNDARPMPNFQNLEQKNLAGFFATARALENTGVGAYLGALPSIYSTQYISAAGSIALIEARHAGVLNDMANAPITANVLAPNADQSFDRPLTISQVTTLAGPFIKDLNGGPPLTFDTQASADNDIAILNFALALEYLEATFYNINIPKFFKN